MSNINIKISDKDKELLFHLSLNGRLSQTELSSKMDMSKQAVSYRLKRLEDVGIIQKYYAITNIYNLGQTHYRVFIKLQNITPEKEAELNKFLINHPSISWVLYLDGDYDIFFVLWCSNIIEFEKIYDQIIDRFGKYFMQKNFSIVTRIEYLHFRFLRPTNEQPPSPLIFGAGFKNAVIDETDRNLLNYLNRNCRITANSLAEKLGLSTRMVNKRINALIQNNIIIGFNIKMDFSQAGYTYQKILLQLNVTSDEKLAELKNHLRKNPSVIYLLKTIGPYDFEFELITRDQRECYETVKDLRFKFGDIITGYDMVIMKKEPKYEHLQL